MTDAAIQQARQALASIPYFANLDVGDENQVGVTRLGGMTNLVFRVDTGKERVCLRLPGPGTEEYIDRENEEKASRQTAQAGVSPEVLYMSPQSGILVAKYVDDATTMSPELFRSRQGSPARAGRAFRQLHDSGAEFPFRFELFSMIDEYLELLDGKEVEFPDGYHDILQEAETVRSALDAHSLPLAACHCDPLCENFLDTGERMWIVDWEYSGMNDPMWDLGDLSVEGGFNEKQDEEMIRAYFGGEPRPDQRGRIIVYKAMCDLLWTLWGLIQHANNNPAEDFRAYATERFERCKALMSEQEFSRHVKAVTAGGA